MKVEHLSDPFDWYLDATAAYINNYYGNIMKVERKEKEFSPVVITLETVEEYNTFFHSLYVARWFAQPGRVPKPEKISDFVEKILNLLDSANGVK